MVLETFVGPLLNRFLQKYIEGLSSKDVTTPILGGDIRLKNLKLKKEALDKFRLPVDVKDGYIGTLSLSIPWFAVGCSLALAVIICESRLKPISSSNPSQSRST